MHEIIDLSQETFSDMPVFPGLLEVKITMHVSHEQWYGITDSGVVSPTVNQLELGFMHYENMVNLYQLIGRGRFSFIGLPLKIRGGTDSPVRAVAVFER
jgi:kynurenine formamidase